MRKVARELKRVVAEGRIVCIVCDDTLIEGKKYPVVADLTKIYIEEGFILSVAFKTPCESERIQKGLSDKEKMEGIGILFSGRAMSFKGKKFNSFGKISLL